MFYLQKMYLEIINERLMKNKKQKFYIVAIANIITK